jgi:hypothetical protein
MHNKNHGSEMDNKASYHSIYNFTIQVCSKLVRLSLSSTSNLIYFLQFIAYLIELDFALRLSY